MGQRLWTPRVCLARREVGPTATPAARQLDASAVLAAPALSADTLQLVVPPLQRYDLIMTAPHGSAAWSQHPEHRLSTPPARQPPRTPLRVTSLPLPLQVPWPTQDAHCHLLYCFYQQACNLHASHRSWDRASGWECRCSVLHPPTHSHCRRAACRTFQRAVRPWTPACSPAAAWAVLQAPPPTTVARWSAPQSRKRCICRHVDTAAVASPHQQSTVTPPHQQSTVAMTAQGGCMMTHAIKQQRSTRSRSSLPQVPGFGKNDFALS